jgi:phospholipase/lecithinase/hemolysin
MKNHLRFLIGMLMSLAIMGATPSIASINPPRLIIFGDSYSTADENLVWVDLLVQHLFRIQRINYARGGARATDNPNHDRDLPEQIDLYLEDLNTTGSSPHINDLHTVWNGGNDLLSNLDPIIVADAVREQVQRLIDEGATQIVLPDMVPLGLMPAFNAYPQAVEARNAQAAAFVDRLRKHVRLLQTDNPGVLLKVVRVHELVRCVLREPSKYGLTNWTDRFDQAPAGANQSAYLWQDNVHMTPVGHEIIGHFAALVLKHRNYEYMSYPGRCLGW